VGVVKPYVVLLRADDGTTIARHVRARDDGHAREQGAVIAGALARVPLSDVERAVLGAPAGTTWTRGVEVWMVMEVVTP